MEEGLFWNSILLLKLCVWQKSHSPLSKEVGNAQVGIPLLRQAVTIFGEKQASPIKTNVLKDK
jgi:hypothetical protein